MSDFRYPGTELILFSRATNWKSYWSRLIGPFVQGDVVEVGSGIGANTAFLRGYTKGEWLCLEPDKNLAGWLTDSLSAVGDTCNVQVVCSTLSELDEARRFDTVLYIDVLEHIENDAEEMELAAARLRSGGRIIVLAPAHQALFTEFDASIGHFRRYNREAFRAISPKGFRIERIIYLDSVGLAASAANRFLLKQAMPTIEQLGFWDRWMIPASTIFDRLMRYKAGKSVLGIWMRAQSLQGRATSRSLACEQKELLHLTNDREDDRHRI